MKRIVLTRNGHAAAVLISPEDLAQLEETIDVLGDPAALADIREADKAYAGGMSSAVSRQSADCANGEQ